MKRWPSSRRKRWSAEALTSTLGACMGRIARLVIRRPMGRRMRRRRRRMINIVSSQTNSK